MQKRAHRVFLRTHRVCPKKLSEFSLPKQNRYRPKGVFGKGVGNSKIASEMHQNGSCFIGKRGTFQNASEMHQNCVKIARNTFGGEHLLDDTDRTLETVFRPFPGVGRADMKRTALCAPNGFFAALREDLPKFVRLEWVSDNEACMCIDAAATLPRNLNAARCPCCRFHRHPCCCVSYVACHNSKPYIFLCFPRQLL